MGTMDRQWTVKEAPAPERVEQLSTELGIDRVLAALLIQRGVSTFDQARTFFRPRLEDLHDPFLMTDMDKAVERLHAAITSGEKILVYGDYDVDGTTAVAQVYSFVKQFSAGLGLGQRNWPGYHAGLRDQGHRQSGICPHQGH